MKFKEDKRGRFITITGRDIDPSLFDKIVALDSDVFSEDSTDFQADTSMPEDVLKSYLEKNILTTTIIYDRKEDKVVGYFQAFPLEKEFAQDYIDGKKTFKDITSDVVATYENGKPLCLYVWSVGISDEYRGKAIEDFGGELNGKKMYKVLLTEFMKSVIAVTKQGANIETVLCEGVSKKGQNLARKITGNHVVHEDKENDFLLCYSEFDPSKLLDESDRSKDLIPIELVEEYRRAKQKDSRKVLGNDLDKLTGKDEYNKGKNKE